MCDTKKLTVKVSEDSRFVDVVGERRPIKVENRDSVTSPTAGGHPMEELGVLVTFKGVPGFSPSAPVKPSLADGEMEGVDGKRAKDFL